MATREPPNRLDPLVLPSAVSHVSKCGLIEQKRFKDNLAQVTLGGRTYIHKKHVSADEDLLFSAEIRAYTLCNIRSPHVVDFIGYTTDEEDKVDGMLLEFCPKYDLMRHLRKNGNCDWKLKMKWAAQITHGLMEIHGVGVTHGDLRAENVVLDDKLDAKIIDIVQGWGMMFGWNPWRFPESEDIHKPHWDIYSLGVTLWEIATDGKTPPENQTPSFDLPIFDNEVAMRIASVARKCLSDSPGDRPTAEAVFNELNGLDICGCKTEGSDSCDV
jgi:serine/threonine protein kinase